MNKRIKLSFEDDEEEEIPIISKKVTKGGKQPVRRIIQASMATDGEPSPAAVSSLLTATSTGLVPESHASYSKADLAALRGAQNFAKPSLKATDIVEVDKDAMDVVELSGDQAEALEEKLYGKHQEDESEETKDFESMRSAKAHTKELLHRKKPDRIYTSLPTVNKKAEFEYDIDVNHDWEEEVIQRGVLQSKSDTSSMFGSNLRGADIPRNDTDILDIIHLMQTRMDKMRSDIEEGERSITLLRNELKVSEDKILSQDRTVELALTRLRGIEVQFSF